MITIESWRIRDPRVRCFTWSFEADDRVCSEIDRLVSTGRIAEINCERQPYACSSYWSAEVSFSGLEHKCSSSTEYPMSVLGMEEGLMVLADSLADNICCNPEDCDTISSEISENGRESLSIEAGRDSPISVSFADGDVVKRAMKNYSGPFWRKISGIAVSYPLSGPYDFREYGFTQMSGHVFLKYGDQSYRVDFSGSGLGWWAEMAAELAKACKSVLKSKASGKPSSK